MPGVPGSWGAVATAVTTPAAAPVTAERESAGTGAMAALAGMLSEAGWIASARRHSQAVRRRCGLTVQPVASAGMAGPVAADWDCGAGSDPAAEPEDREDSPDQGPAARGGVRQRAKGGGIWQPELGATLTSTTGLVIEFNVATGNAGGGGGLAGNAAPASRAEAVGATGNGRSGGEATGNDGGFGGLGGEGFGGGLYNDVGGTVVYKAGKNPKNPTPSLFLSNTAEGGLGGFGGDGGTGGGGDSNT